MKSAIQASTSSPASVFTQLSRTALTSSGLVPLSREDGEVELLVANDVTVWDATVQPSLRVSHSMPMVTLTSHRIVFHIRNQMGEVPFLHLRHIVRTEASAVMLLSLSSSPHIIIYTDSMGSYGLVFRQRRDRDTWIAAIDKAIERRGWQDSSSKLQIKNSISDEMTSKGNRSVGVEAILSRNQLKHEHAQKVTQEAFQINSSNMSTSSQKSLSPQEKQELVEKLFTEATELVSIIHKYIATIEHHNQQLKQQQQCQTLNEKTECQEVDDDPMNQLLDMLNEMGMTTALSKAQNRSSSLSSSSSSSSDFYYSTLARQLVDFLQYRNRLQNSGGILALTDINCFFNRARGANTISPQDLLQACQHLKTLSLGISLRVFPSGVMVLQDDTLMDDTVIIQKIYSLVWSKQECTSDSITSLSLIKAISTMDVSRILNVSPLLAQELLQIVETAGYICRDYTMEQGILYFPNCFVSTTKIDCITFKQLQQ